MKDRGQDKADAVEADAVEADAVQDAPGAGRCRVVARAVGLVALGVAIGAAGALSTGAVVALARGRGGDGDLDVILCCAFFLLPAVPLAWRLLVRPGPTSAGVPVGVVVGVLLLRAATGAAVGTVWAAPADRGSGVEAVGSWVSGGVVVRAREDEVVAYRVATGAVAWHWTPPGRAVVCAMSAEVSGGTGLLGYADDGRPCDAVVAMDLSSGRPAWTTRLRAPAPDVAQDDVDGTVPGSIALAGGTAVLAEHDGWHAVALADARPRWRVRLAPGCTPLRVAGDGASVVAVDACGRSGATVRQLRASDGRPVFRSVLPVRDGLDDVAVLSCAPPTVWVDEHGARGTDAVLAYGPGGRLTARIPLAEPHGDLSLPLGSTDQGAPAFADRPAYGAVVTGGLLVVPATVPGDGSEPDAPGRLVAYSLAGGAHRWTAGVDAGVDGITAQGGSVWALTTTSTLYRFDAATGRRTTSATVYGTRQIFPGDLWRSGGWTVLVDENGTENNDSDAAPVRVLN